MKYDNATPHEKAIERSTNAGFSSGPELEQTFTEGARVREPKIWAMFHEKFNNPSVVGEYVGRPRFDFSPHSRMKILDGVPHETMFSYLRTCRKLTNLKS